MNIVIIVADTARMEVAQEIFGTSGWAADATQYTNTFAAAPWSLPSHASLFTGTHSSKHGAHADHKELSTDPITLAEIFTSEGYETVGVSNNTWISSEFGFDRGFDLFHKSWQYVQTDTDLGEIARMEMGTDKVLAAIQTLMDGHPFANVTNALYGKFLRKKNDYGAKATNDWLEGWLESRDDTNPFFLFVNYLEPHLEYRPPEEFAELFLPDETTYSDAMDIPQDAWAYIAGKTAISEQEFEILRALYRAELAYLDYRLGELKTMLEDAGKWEDTVFVVTGDHGENIGDHGLMDHQYCLYDTLLHVPLTITGGAFSGGGKCDRLIQLTDLAPTLLDVAGIDAPSARKQFQGTSFHPEADREEREYVIGEYMAPQPTMDALEQRVGELPDDVYTYDRSLRSIRSNEYKLIRGSDGSRELYDIDTDPAEQQDILDANGAIADELESKLDSWVESFEHADSSGTTSMTQSTKERLEDLGYLQ